MNLRPHRKHPIEPNLTPLIDVLFLLLIFFMVSTTFDDKSRINIVLPEATSNEQKAQMEEFLEVTVDAKGRYYVNQKEVINTELTTLRRAIAKAGGGNVELPVIITADAKATHQAVLKVMDAASQLGYTHMTFKARQPK